MVRDASMFSKVDLMTLWMVASTADNANTASEDREKVMWWGEAGRTFVQYTIMPDKSVNAAGLLEYCCLAHYSNQTFSRYCDHCITN